jgi:hypothetical protein
MDFNKTVDLIIRDLNEARDIIDDLKNYPGVPALQVELAKSKCKNAAEVISLFKDLQSDVHAEVKKTKESQKTEDGRQKSEDRSQKPSEVSRSPHSESTEPPHTTKKIPESTIIADTFDHLPGSLNKKLESLRDENEVPDYLKVKLLTNLSQAIGVNDRFLFIRELFNGNPDSYSQAISMIDEATSLTDAKALMMSYTGDKVDTEAGKQLLDLLKRKFPGDE